MGGHVTLYTIGGCPYCARARESLESAGRSYTEIDIGARRERLPELLKLTGGRRVVPVMVDDGGVAVAPDGGSEF
jgi:glutaredoxin 3